MSQPLLVLSDVHLSRRYGQRASADLARLIDQHPDAEVVLAGDIFDLTLDQTNIAVEQSLSAATAPHGALMETLQRHLQGPGRLSFVPGNHDASINDARAILHLRTLLGVPNAEKLQVFPWFLRRGGVHVEHGHLYDPDCAPNHPLADPNPNHEALGNALMRRFVARNDAFYFAHKNQTTMTSGIAAAFAQWGPRAPLLIARYFQTAFSLWAEAGLRGPSVQQQKAQGEGRLAAYAAAHGLLQESLEQMLRSAPSPTHHSARDLFFRLYFDRVMAAASLVAGASLLTSAGLGAALAWTPLLSATGALTKSGALLSALGAGYLFTNVSRAKNRYGHAVIAQLEGAALGIAKATDADLVVLGHSHVEVDQPRYVNLGSFGFPRAGRPYLAISTQGRHEKRWL